MPIICEAISAPAAKALKLAHALGVRNGLRDAQGNIRDATLNDVQAEVIDHLRNIVKQVQQQEAASTTLDLT